MILFASEQERGYFVPEVAQKYNEQSEFSGFVSSLDELAKQILKGSYSMVILHLPTLVIMDYKNIGNFCKNIYIANSEIRIVVMAEGYNINSQIIQASIGSGVRFFMLGTNPSMLKSELSDAIQGKTNIEEIFNQLPTENLRDSKKTEINESYKTSKTIAVAGSMHRIGTTTQALQIVKYLLLNGFKACYIQMNSSEYVQSAKNYYVGTIIDEETGKITYQSVDMFYKKEKIADILTPHYDYYVYDFGCMLNSSESSIVQFLEKDIRIIVCGSKANEIQNFQGVTDLTGTSSVEYIFSFTSQSDQNDILELMEDKKNHTYFCGYIPDPFSYNPECNDSFDRIIKPEKVKKEPEKKHRFALFHYKKDKLK